MSDLIERLRGDLIVTNELHEVEIRHEAADALGLATAEIEKLKDQWYSPSHMDAVQERTIDPQRKRIEQFTDALDHIMRVCRNTDVQTKRLLWIEKRAECAINGIEEWREYDYPKVRKAAKENHELRERIEQLETALNWIGDAHIDDMTEIIDYARESAQSAGDSES